MGEGGGEVAGGHLIRSIDAPDTSQVPRHVN